MKRFVYELYYPELYQHSATEYWNAKNYREAKKQIFELYEDEIKSGYAKITFIAEIKYEKDEYEED